MNSAQLRAVYADAVAARRSGTRAACPAPEALLAVVRREGPERERVATVNHALACAACRSELELLRGLEKAGAADASAAVKRSPWRRYVGLALAASALLAVTVGPGRRLWERESPVRGGDDEVRAVSPAADVVVRTTSAPALTFTWRAVPDASRYTLQVLTSGGASVFRGASRDTTLAIPPRAALPPGDYRWWVSAWGQDGSERRSAPRRLRVTR